MDAFGSGRPPVHTNPVVIVASASPTAHLGQSHQNSGSAHKAGETLSSVTAHRRKRLTRSENVVCCRHRGWEALFRESLLHMAWPISLSMSADGDTLGVSDFLPLKLR